jgi:hypothetical protein
MLLRTMNFLKHLDTIENEIEEIVEIVDCDIIVYLFSRQFF